MTRYTEHDLKIMVKATLKEKRKAEPKLRWTLRYVPWTIVIDGPNTCLSVHLVNNQALVCDYHIAI